MSVPNYLEESINNNVFNNMIHDQVTSINNINSQKQTLWTG